jgi:hypothetical protein
MWFVSVFMAENTKSETTINVSAVEFALVIVGDMSVSPAFGCLPRLSLKQVGYSIRC